MPKASDILRLPFRLHTFDVDPAGQLTPAAVARFFQEAASVHATLWGFGADRLIQGGTFWALLRFAVGFYELPTWRPNIDLMMVTWSRGLRKLQAYRDFELLGPAGQQVAAGTSSWIALDLATRRPHRLDVSSSNFPHFPDRHAIPPAAVESSLPIIPMDPAPLLSFDARLSDLDMNAHVNNTRYLDWSLDAIAPAHWQTHRLTGVTMNFLAETVAGDPVTVHADPTREHVLVRTANRDACRVRLTTRNR